MTLRSKIATAALGLLLATGAASAQTGLTRPTAPVSAQTRTDTAPAKTATIAHKSHRLHVTHRTIKHAKVAHRSLHSKVVHKAGPKHLAKAHLVGTQKHAMNTKTSIVR